MHELLCQKLINKLKMKKIQKKLNQRKIISLAPELLERQVSQDKDKRKDPFYSIEKLNTFRTVIFDEKYLGIMTTDTQIICQIGNTEVKFLCCKRI